MGGGRPRPERRVLLRAGAVGLAALAGCPGAGRLEGGPPEPDGWRLVFEDDFERGLDRWSVGHGVEGPGAERVVPGNVGVRNSHLRLRASRSDGGYLSGAVNTRGTFARERGFFEVKLRTPHGKGFLPVFRARPADGSFPPGIDFLAVPGGEPGGARFAVHWSPPGTDAHRRAVDTYSGPDFSATHHVVGCRWGTDALTWYVNGERIGRLTAGVAALDRPLFLGLSLHVGADRYGAAPPDESTPWPAFLDADWVRVWAPA